MINLTVSIRIKDIYILLKTKKEILNCNKLIEKILNHLSFKHSNIFSYHQNKKKGIKIKN